MIETPVSKIRSEYNTKYVFKLSRCTFRRSITDARARHPWAKGFTNFAKSPYDTFSYLSLLAVLPRGDLKGRQVKVPHRAQRDCLFSTLSRFPLFRLLYTPPSHSFPSLFLSFLPSQQHARSSTTTGTGPDIALSRARSAPLFSGRTIGNMWHEG